jgi:hypothetical protein
MAEGRSSVHLEIQQTSESLYNRLIKSQELTGKEAELFHTTTLVNGAIVHNQDALLLWIGVHVRELGRYANQMSEG